MLFFLKSQWNQKFLAFSMNMLALGYYLRLLGYYRLSVSLLQNKICIYKIRAFKTYSLSLPPIWITDFDDITLHFSFSSNFLSN